MPDPFDNCTAVANPGQEVNTQLPGFDSSPVGRACACLCGDVNRDCVIDATDALEIKLDAGFAPAQLLWDPVYCDINRDGNCDVIDALTIQTWSGFMGAALDFTPGPPHGPPGSGIVCW